MQNVFANGEIKSCSSGYVAEYRLDRQDLVFVRRQVRYEMLAAIFHGSRRDGDEGPRGFHKTIRLAALPDPSVISYPKSPLHDADGGEAMSDGQDEDSTIRLGRKKSRTHKIT